MSWEVVIGLEIHVQLATKSKIFSAAATTFGAEPNTQACAVDLALPGTLPVFNEDALRKAVIFGLAIDAEIGMRSVFDRKNYFYPDLPKGYQGTQMDFPIVGRGEVDINLSDGRSKTIGVTRAHLEEDAGKSLHEEFHDSTGIDLNRAGTPLLEIVSEPEIGNAEEAVAYLKYINALVRYLGISDGNMSQGSMRCDVNLSLREAGTTELGTRTEIKNVNSFRFVEKAIATEIQRQQDILEDGGRVVQETRLYDAERNETRPMRSKEVANDYRYFPEPDLLPVVIDEEALAAIRESLPELPRAKRARFVERYDLSAYDAGLLSTDGDTANYFEAVVKDCDDAKAAANWIMGELAARLNKAELEPTDCPVSSHQLATLIQRINDDTISSKIAKTVFDELWQKNGSVDEIIEQKGLKQVSDSGAIEAMVDQVIADNPQQVENFRAAEPDKQKKMLGFFVGQIMKLSQGKANPGQVNKLLNDKLSH